MSRFQDPYLAESTGFSTGHANGIAQGVGIGRKQGYNNGLSAGYTEGWNAAANEANSKLSQKDRIIENLNRQLKHSTDLINQNTEKSKSEKIEMTQQISSLIDRVNLLTKLYKELHDDNEIKEKKHEEEKEVYREKINQISVDFLGMTAIARAAMKVVSSANIIEKDEFIENYANLSIELQTQEYISKNRFPHNQKFVKPHIPDICSILEIIIPETRSYSENNSKP